MDKRDYIFVLFVLANIVIFTWHIIIVKANYRKAKQILSSSEEIRKRAVATYKDAQEEKKQSDHILKRARQKEEMAEAKLRKTNMYTS